MEGPYKKAKTSGERVRHLLSILRTIATSFAKLTFEVQATLVTTVNPPSVKEVLEVTTAPFIISQFDSLLKV
jgi:hypothetical protein